MTLERLSAIIAIPMGAITWLTCPHEATKWFLAGVVTAIIAFESVFEVRRLRQRDAPQTNSTTPNTPMTYEEIMNEDTRELLRMKREKLQRTNDFFLENARKKHGL